MLQAPYSIKDVKVKRPCRLWILRTRTVLWSFKEDLEADPIRDIESIRMTRDAIQILTRIIQKDNETDFLEHAGHAVMG